MKPAYRAVYVEWVDSVISHDPGWEDLKDAKSVRPPLIKTVGWLLTEDTDCLVVAASDGGHEVHGDICIPKPCIKKRRVIRL